MAHPGSNEFFELFITKFADLFGNRVIDIGSNDINGGPQTLIHPREYVGVDLAQGDNVTLISSGHLIDLPSHYFSVAMSSQCFEHNPVWKETFSNMVRLTCPTGLVIWSAASIGAAEHGTTKSDNGFAAPSAVNSDQEYYGNVKESDVLNVMNYDYHFSRYFIFTDYKERNVFFAGLGKTASIHHQNLFVELISEFKRKRRFSFICRNRILAVNDSLARKVQDAYFRGLAYRVVIKIWINPLNPFRKKKI